MTETTDPVVVRRAKIARMAGLARRVGYTMWLIAVVIFFVGFATTFTSIQAQIIVGLLIAGSVLLLPAIIIGYGVNAANRDEAREAAEAQRNAG